VPKSEISIKQRIHIEFKNINNFAYLKKRVPSLKDLQRLQIVMVGTEKKSPYRSLYKGFFSGYYTKLPF